MGSSTISKPDNEPESQKTPNSKGSDRDNPAKLGFEKQAMVDWYSPTKLLQTGVRAIISKIFGNYADKREMQAALESGEQLNATADFSDREGVWIDYVSDLGSGWNSTYSVAYLLGRKMLKVPDSNGQLHELPRGNILVMGGDEVYPTASWKEYRNRLTGPYRCSLPYVDKDAPLLLSIPGNHDWYDGLSSFIKLFCQKRWIGGWKTIQTRSYFAIKLPHDWWLWGIDIQLSADIDKPQLDYFDHMCEKASAGDNIILCTAEPAWVYQEYRSNDKPYKNLNFFRKRYAKKNEKKLNFRLMLTGDLHHYTSFRNPDDPETDWKITAGGGGAFSHPTHQVSDELHLGDETYQKSAAYPNAKDSKKMAWNNLKFPFINKRFGAFFAVVYVLFAWFTAVGITTHIGQTSVLKSLADLSSILEALQFYGSILLINPELAIFLLIVFTGLLAFSDRKREGSVVGAWVLGGGHGLVQVLLILISVWFVSRLVLSVWSIALLTWPALVFFIVVIALAGWLLSGFVMGIYLLIATLVLKTHDTEAYSSFRGEDHKNFIRFRADKAGLTLYPIKIPKVGQKWTYKPGVEGEKAWYDPEEKMQYELIEDPIHIKKQN